MYAWFSYVFLKIAWVFFVFFYINQLLAFFVQHAMNLGSLSSFGLIVLIGNEKCKQQ